VVPAPLENIYERGPYIAQTFLYGANKPYNVLLIVPNYQEFIAYAKLHKKQDLLQSIPRDLTQLPSLTDNDLENMFRNEEFVSLITQEIIRNGKNCKHYEQPVMWLPLVHPFSQENQMQTPKMSLRRPNVLKAYQQKIDDMYDGKIGHRIQYPPSTVAASKQE
jgi:long-chain acyl-CoA synthetase